MSVLKSSHFLSVSASGDDWREISKDILEQVDAACDQLDSYNFGFLYVSDHLVDDAQSFLSLLTSVLGVKHWIGGVAVAVSSHEGVFFDKPAVSVMLCAFEPEEFCVFQASDGDIRSAAKTLEPWLEERDPMLVFVHGNPFAVEDPIAPTAKLAQFTNGFVMGGLTSSRHAQLQFADSVFEGDVSGAVFADSVTVSTMISQGCRTIGSAHLITRCVDQTVLELDGKRPLDVFEEDLRSMVIKKIDRDPDDIIVDENDIPEEYQFLLKGEMHVALPVSESDQKDYLVRHINDVSHDEGSITVGEAISVGDRLMFVHRNNTTLGEDLSKSLVQLRARVMHEQGCFEPKAALYVSCAGRLGHEDLDEIDLIREIIGDVPLTGFYAGGEISNARLYSYTGALILFF